MNSKNLSTATLIMLLILACSKDDATVTEVDILRSTFSTYDYDECGVELKGLFQSPGTQTELGFVYSYENREPTIMDSVIVFTDMMDRTIFKVLFKEYVFPRRLYWNTYALIDGEYIYGQRKSFERVFPAFREEIFELSFDCYDPDRLLKIHRIPKCHTVDYIYTVCLHSPEIPQNCMDFPIVEDRTVDLKLDDDVTRASISVYELDHPNFSKLNFTLQIPEIDQEVQSQNLSNMPTAVAESTSFTIQDNFYVCAGYTTSSKAYTNAFWKYDLKNDEWTQLPDFPGTARAFMISFVIDDIAYVGSGGTSEKAEKDFYSFNPATNEWDSLADMPRAGTSGVAFVTGGNGYVTKMIETDARFGTDIRTLVYKYNPERGSWTILSERAPFISETARNIGFSYNDYGYIINDGYENTELYSYNQAEGWGFLGEIYVKSDDAIAIAKDNVIYLTTGRGLDGILKFDLNSNEQSLLCLETQRLRSEAVASVYGDKIIIAGGIEAGSDDPTIFTAALSSTYSLSIPK